MSDETISAVPESAPEQAPSAPAPAPAEPRKTQFNSVADAVAELDRRESERRAANQAAKAAKQASQAPDPAPEPEEADDEPPSPDPLESSREDFDESDEVTPDKPQDEPDDAGSDPDLDDIEINGKRYKVPKDAALRQADYTRKTQELAADRAQVQAAHQQTSQIAQQLQQAQAVLAQFYQAAIGQPPSLELAQSDPQAYLVQRGLHEQRLQAFQRLSQQGQELAANQRQMNDQQLAQVKARETAELVRHLPELKSPEKRAQFAAKAIEVGQRYGYSADEISAVMDHRAVRMLADLAKLQDRSAVEKTVKTKLANVPPKSARPGAATQDGGKSARAQDAKRQFMKSGRSLKDVARYLSQTEE